MFQLAVTSFTTGMIISWGINPNPGTALWWAALTTSVVGAGIILLYLLAILLDW